LEPEAASIWCEKISPEVNAILSKTGTRYMVVDLGGLLENLKLVLVFF